MKNYRRRKKNMAKKEYLESICDKMMKFQRENIMIECNDEGSELERKPWKNNGTEHSKRNIIPDKRQVLRVRVNYITQLYGQRN
jgi:hypothetical protein